MNKLYSSKSNARRGAVKALGSTRSMEGFDYKIINQDGKWTWATIAKSDPGVAEAAKAEDTKAPEPKPTVQSKPARKPREGTKQSLLISMLRRPEGATISQIVEATGWQRHSARGVISGAIKKKLGLTVTSEKHKHGDRIYRTPV